MNNEHLPPTVHVSTKGGEPVLLSKEDRFQLAIMDAKKELNDMWQDKLVTTEQRIVLLNTPFCDVGYSAWLMIQHRVSAAASDGTLSKLEEQLDAEEKQLARSWWRKLLGI